MYVLHSEKLIYLAQPRTASLAVRSWLEENYEVERITSFPMWPPGWGDHHSIDLPAFKDFKLAGYRVWCCVRNHWDWLVSIYHWDKKGFKDATFNYYLSELFMGPTHTNLFTIQSDPIFYGQRYGLKPKKGYLFWLYPQFSDVVMRYETQEQELSELLDREVVLEHKNVTEDREPTSSYYSAAMALHVSTLFRAEIEELEYGFPE